MEHKRISLIDVVESFLTGISCLVGGDQLYLFVSQTNASPKTQYYLSLLLVIMTLIVAFVLYDEYFEDFMNAVHLVYVTTLLFLVLILYSRIKSTTIVTLCNIFISIVLTTFVLSCCISYSIDRVLLLTFILGLFGSRLLPTLCWIFIDDLNPNIDTQLSNFALKLYLVRFIICITSIIRKVIYNNFGISILYFRTIQNDFGPISLISFVTIFEHLKNLFMTFFNYLDYISDYHFYFNIFPLQLYIPLLLIAPYFCFITSFIIIISLHPSINLSSELLSYTPYINIFKSLSHLFGSLLGIVYPLSVSVYSISFSLLYFLYVIYILILVVIYRHIIVLSNFVINLIVIISGIFLGYIFSYSLGIIYNITLSKICIYEEIESCIYEKDVEKCCQNVLKGFCYCIDKKNIVNINTISDNEKSLSCRKSFLEYISIKHSSKANNAILILYNSVDSSYIKCCTDECTTVCNGSSSCKCLKLLGVYKLETITTSSCDMCQLTVRLEAKKVCSSDNCPGSGGDECRCTVSDCKCCCLAVGCCSASSSCSPTNCNCIKLCCCKTCRSCQCTNWNPNEVRIFFGYKKNGESCIKEIKPADPNFEGSLGKQNDFYIGGISIRNCCHVDLQVDLYCYMKNSFYRMTGVNYSMKSIMPKSITLMRDVGECCTTKPQSQCCCINAALVRLCLEYESDYIYYDDERANLNKCQLECKCTAGGNHTCGCCTHTSGAGKCCCCKTFTIERSVRSSFYKRTEPVKIKLISLYMMIFVTLFFVTSKIISINKTKKIKRYDFKRIKSFDKISKAAKKYKINYIESVNKRLNLTVSNETINNSIVNKSEDLKNTIKLFSEVLDDESFKKLNKKINEKSDKYIKKTKSNNSNISKDDIIWSYCIGLMYSYVIKMFLNIQKYFIRWEYVWRREHFNYQKTIDSTFGTITHNSKCGLANISEINLQEKTPYCITKQRTTSFNKTYNELIRYIDINENEIKYNKSIPNDIGERLKYFIDKWDHRIVLISHLIDIKSNMFDWDLFICNYSYIRQWFETFYPYLEKAAKEVQIPEKNLNKNVPLSMINVV